MFYIILLLCSFLITSILFSENVEDFIVGMVIMGILFYELYRQFMIWRKNENQGNGVD
jgi:hypothetical protein